MHCKLVFSPNDKQIVPSRKSAQSTPTAKPWKTLRRMASTKLILATKRRTPLKRAHRGNEGRWTADHIAPTACSPEGGKNASQCLFSDPCDSSRNHQLRPRPKVSQHNNAILFWSLRTDWKLLSEKEERDGTGFNFPAFERDGSVFDFPVRPCMYGIVREYQDETGESQPDARGTEGCDSPCQIRVRALWLHFWSTSRLGGIDRDITTLWAHALIGHCLGNSHVTCQKAISLLVACQSAASISWKPSHDMGEQAILTLTRSKKKFDKIVHGIMHGLCLPVKRYPGTHRRVHAPSTAALQLNISPLLTWLTAKHTVFLWPLRCFIFSDFWLGTPIQKSKTLFPLLKFNKSNSFWKLITK